MPAASEIPLSNGVTNSHHENAPNGATSINGVSSSNQYKIPLNNQYAFTPRKLRVVTIGAGFSGLLIAHKFQHRFPEMQEYVDHTIYEGHSEMGGTARDKRSNGRSTDLVNEALGLSTHTPVYDAIYS
jgi:hypothetical protein